MRHFRTKRTNLRSQLYACRHQSWRIRSGAFGMPSGEGLEACENVGAADRMRCVGTQTMGTTFLVWKLFVVSTQAKS